MPRRSAKVASALPDSGERPNLSDPHMISHELEYAVRNRLLAQPDVRFSSLVVRRLRNGVCLQGVMEVEDDCPDVASLAKSVAGVEDVLNHLVVLPLKG